jgi:NAD(P)H-dependent flavin oxidoreductase YrpB (nitropropane dioxygenase family)
MTPKPWHRPTKRTPKNELIACIANTPCVILLGCQYPVIQTAMGWVAGSSLVAATTNAGGFGFLAGATIAADQVEAEILRVKELTGDKPFGLNFHMFQTNANQLLDLAIEHKIRAVSYGRGPDKKVIGRLARCWHRVHADCWRFEARPKSHRNGCQCHHRSRR